jgi:hypothetical protein
MYARIQIVRPRDGKRVGILGHGVLMRPTGVAVTHAHPQRIVVRFVVVCASVCVCVCLRVCVFFIL